MVPRAVLERDIFIGCIVLVIALGFITYLTLWSRKTITFIAQKKLRATREILKELDERD